MFALVLRDIVCKYFNFLWEQFLYAITIFLSNFFDWPVLITEILLSGIWFILYFNKKEKRKKRA